VFTTVAIPPSPWKRRLRPFSKVWICWQGKYFERAARSIRLTGEPVSGQAVTGVLSKARIRIFALVLTVYEEPFTSTSVALSRFCRRK
jgi:hypothetical protein